jgi:ferritin
MNRLSAPIEKILNTQIANELNSEKLYRAMGNCMEYSGWNGAAKLWKKYASEEHGHAEKIISFMQDLDCLPQISATIEPQKKFEGIKDIVLKSDEHEWLITTQWKTIAQTALKENDLLTFGLAQEFIKEQVEELAKTNYWVNRIEMFELTNKPLGDLDDEMGEKV